MQGTLTPTAPFDFNKSLEFLGQFRPAMGEQRTEDGILTKTVSVNGQVIVFRVQSIGSVDAPELPCILDGDEPIDEELHQTLCDRITFSSAWMMTYAPSTRLAKTTRASSWSSRNCTATIR
jgi:DNA-3-methyladenine glycosylase II